MENKKHPIQIRLTNNHTGLAPDRQMAGDASIKARIDVQWPVSDVVELEVSDSVDSELRGQINAGK